jgi:hypothetical protein
MARPALPTPGQKHVHDDFEEIMVEVMHQERLAQTIARLDAEIKRDESRARSQTQAAQRTQSKQAAAVSNGSTRPRARPQHSDPRLRRSRTSPTGKQGHHAGPNYALGIIAIVAAGLTISILGAVFAIAVRLKRILI